MRTNVILLVFLFSLVSDVLSSDDCNGGSCDVNSFVQKMWRLAPAIKSRESVDSIQPHIIPLRRELVPVKRKGKVVSFKTSYSGVISVGRPVPGTAPQQFRVVFDTGSGHLILPAAECTSEACLVHTRYNQSASSTASAINQDGSTVRPGMLCEQATIAFGTGKVRGEFVRDTVCLGSPPEGTVGEEALGSHCVTMNTVMAVEMSTMPFKTFGFDGILGMGLSSLALNKQFSFFDLMTRNRSLAPHFAVFLTEGEDGEESEIAMGGHNPARLLSPIAWSEVVMPEMGHWQVQILSIRIGDQLLDACQDGTCRAVVDTGTSHLGVPTPYDEEVTKLLTMPAGDILDCRLADMPDIVIELPGINISLKPQTYMRRLPLREDVNVDSKVELKPLVKPANGDPIATASATTTANAAPTDSNQLEPAENVTRFCRPRLMPVKIPAPLGPKLFILGEPVLHRYYTVFDWSGPRVGMALANAKINLVDKSKDTDKIGSLPKDMDVFLMQQSVTSSSKAVNSKLGDEL